LKPNLTDVSYDLKSCNYTNGALICNQIPIAEVKTVFHQTTILTLKSFHLILQPFIFKDTTIPKDILGSTKTLELSVKYPCSCSYGNSSLILQVDSNAFQSTKNYTKTFEADTIDCGLLDFNFLSGFDQLNELLLLNIWNIEYCLPSLPSLPSLKFLQAKYCAGCNELYSFPPLTNGLVRVEFMGFDDLSPDRYLYYNNISTIEPDELAFSAPVLKLSIFGNGIKDIRPGAFRGKYIKA